MTEFKKIEPGVWKPEKKGDSIEGVLIRVDKQVGKYKSTIYHLEVTNDKGEQQQFAVFGSAILDDRMSYVKEGQIVKIVYQGKDKNQKGQEVNLYDVYKETPPHPDPDADTE